MPGLTPHGPTTRLFLYAALGAIAIGLVVSWIVGGALVRPAPSKVGDPPPDLDADSFVLESESGSTLSGWHARSAKGGGVIVLLHGIRASRLAMVDRARMLQRLGYSTVMVDLRAHGESSGDQITVGNLERFDVRAAVDFAKRQHPNEAIGVIGVSLGGAVALLASPLEIDALVLESVYPTIDDAIGNRVAAQLGPLSPLPTALLMLQLQPRLGVAASQLRPIDHLPNVDCPIFIISGDADRHTTAAETRAMFARAREPKQLWLVEDAAHVDLYAKTPEQYERKVAEFFQLYLREQRSDANE